MFVAFICSCVAALALPSMDGATQPVVLLQTKADKTEPGPPPRLNMLMIAHHKTGMVLALKAAQCVNASTAGILAFKRPARFNSGVPPEGMAVIHFVRDLREISASAYMYHKYASVEPMHISKGTALRMKQAAHPKGMVLAEDMDWYETDDEETYQHWLQRVPRKVGLRALLGQLIPQFETMKMTATYCAEHRGLCIQRDLREFTASTESFDRAWRDIFSFVGIGLEQHDDLKQCIAKLDENSPNFTAADEGPRLTSHVTSTKLTAKRHKDTLQAIKEIDHKFYHDMFQTTYRLA